MTQDILNRRSLRHIDAGPMDIGQHCRAGQLMDRLREAGELAAQAAWLLEVEIDEHAIEKLSLFVEVAREIGRTGKTFREVHVELKRKREAEKAAAEETESA